MKRAAPKTSFYVNRIAVLEHEVDEGRRCMDQLMKALEKAHAERAMARADVRRLELKLAARPEVHQTDYQSL
jgi:hypothetical protein